MTTTEQIGRAVALLCPSGPDKASFIAKALCVNSRTVQRALDPGYDMGFSPEELTALAEMIECRGRVALRLSETATSDRLASEGQALAAKCEAAGALLRSAAVEA